MQVGKNMSTREWQRKTQRDHRDRQARTAELAVWNHALCTRMRRPGGTHTTTTSALVCACQWRLASIRAHECGLPGACVAHGTTAETLVRYCVHASEPPSRLALMRWLRAQQRRRCTGGAPKAAAAAAACSRCDGSKTHYRQQQGGPTQPQNCVARRDGGYAAARLLLLHPAALLRRRSSKKLNTCFRQPRLGLAGG